jgi:hypothetical protein
MPRATCPVGWRGSAYDRKRIAARVAIPHQQMMNPPTSSTIELTASRTIDTVYLVAAGLLCAACLFSLYSFTGFDPAAIQKGDAFTTALDLAGPAGMRLIFAVAGVGAGCGAAASGWRLWDRQPILRANAAGLWVHPSLHRGPLGWGDVVAVGLDGVRPVQLALGLKWRFWSPAHWLTARDVRIALPLIGISHADAVEVVRRMRGWVEAGQ